jgi:glutamate synthase domain-containing protein 2
MRTKFLWVAFISLTLFGAGSWFWPVLLIPLALCVALTALGLADMLQTKQAIRRNFPVLGHGRYLLESIRPEINQYFIESDTDGSPIPRNLRSLVYQRAKGALDTVPFGTQLDLYAPGAEWLTHSMIPAPVPHDPPRLLIGEHTCAQPYSASLMNVSAMSFGSLSNRAVEALNKGAKAGGFAHNTGEGGISEYHLKHGGDLIWQVGTGYFGCRTDKGGFDPFTFSQNAQRPEVKMLELKLSQGAKPAHGGILPASKLTREISKIRGVPMGHDVISPPAHSAFRTPLEMMTFIAQMRDLSGGKPVGIKLCLGKRREFLALCKAMVESGNHPDYIAVDGAEGGTGAAPLEFSNRVGVPLIEALTFVHSALVGSGMRDRVKVLAAGKVVSGFDIARLLAIGADACYSARAMLLAIGCIQARRCNNNTCPTGVATQDLELITGLVVDDKAPRVERFHRETVESFMELLGACGFSNPWDLRPWNIQRRISATEVKHYGDIYEYLKPGSLLDGTASEEMNHLWAYAHAHTFNPMGSGPNPAVMPAPPPSTRAPLQPSRLPRHVLE